MNKLMIGILATSVLPAQALASECLQDSQCATGMCVLYTIPPPPCAWWDIFCDPVTLTGGLCADDVVQLENEYSEECMRPENGSQSIGADVELDTCATTASRNWGLFDFSDGTMMLANSWSNLCLTNSGSDYIQEPCDFDSPGNSQQFVETTESNGSHRLFQNVQDDDCVRGSTTGGSSIYESHTCDQYNSASRHWFYN